MECNAPTLDKVKTCGTTWSGDHYLDLPMPDVRKEWKNARDNNTLGGCGLHKNFTYEDLCDLEESLFQRRILADVPTPDVEEFKEKQSKASTFKSKRHFKRVDECANVCDADEEGESPSKADIAKELKEKLKQEVLKELLADIKGV